MTTQWAILYRYHHVDPVVVNHLQHARRSNPDAAIYGLFGGPEAADHALPSPLLDDAWVAPGRDPLWNWQQSDLSIFQWYKQRGHALPWDRIVAIHWDCLVLGDFRHVLAGIEDRVYIHGLRPLDPRNEMAWFWTSPAQVENRKVFDWFRIQVWEHFYHPGPIYWGNVCVTSVTRSALVRLAEAAQLIGNAGDDEYRMPTLAMLQGLPIHQPNALGDPKATYPINASRTEVPEQFITSQLRHPDGFRVFHPVYKLWPTDQPIGKEEHRSLHQ